MEVSDFDLLVQQLKDRHITILALNGHGETTALQGWDQRVISVADAGLRMSITSNFARLLNENELAAMARIGDITISVDTHRKDLLRDLRRNVDLGNILINMHAVAATASKLGLPSPAFSWSCVVSDRVALDLVDYIHFGLACGVRNFVLCNLTVLVEGAANARHVSTLSVAVLRRFSELLSEAEVISKNAGASLLIEAGLVDSVRQMLSNGTSVGHELIHWQVKGGTRYAASATSDKPTRDCLDPWFFAYLDSGRGLHPCCFHPPIGTLEIGGSLDVLLNGPTVRDLRNQLLTGQLSDLCQQCPGKPLASIDTLRMHLLEELAREQNATTT
jgi:hypothetical protein